MARAVPGHDREQADELGSVRNSEFCRNSIQLPAEGRARYAQAVSEGRYLVDHPLYEIRDSMRMRGLVVGTPEARAERDAFDDWFDCVEFRCTFELEPHRALEVLDHLEAALDELYARG